MIGLYVHIPFCEKVCSYCDFCKRVPKNKEMIDEYLDYLTKDLNQYKEKLSLIKTIYIGGGTPSILDPKQLERLLGLFDEYSVMEYTFEANPDSLTKEKIALLKKHHVNRVSLGVESFQEKALKTLGRSHTPKDIDAVIHNLKEIGITNINIDLMFGLPETTMEDVLKDLESFYHLELPHLSIYSLILEEKSLLYQQIKQKKLIPISDDLEADMFENIIDSLEKHGYVHYEISNFAYPGFESVHNQIYWHNNHYIGVGLGASGYLGDTRYRNNHLLPTYYKNFIEEKNILSPKDHLVEEMILGLRLLKGIDIAKVNQKFNLDVLQEYPEINTMIEKGFLIMDPYLRLTRKGLMFGNDVFEIFI